MGTVGFTTWLTVWHRFICMLSVYSVLLLFMLLLLLLLLPLLLLLLLLLHLRSAFTRRLIIPRTKTSYGDCSFSVHGPSVWNSLPKDLPLSDMSLETFRSRLKAFQFEHWSLDSPFAAVCEFGLLLLSLLLLQLQLLIIMFKCRHLQKLLQCQALRRCSLGINGEGKSSGQLDNPCSPGKKPLKCCVHVCQSIQR